MTRPPRVPLTVTSEAPIPLGALSVEIIPENGDLIQFALTSHHFEHVVEVPPGRCAVVACHPNEVCFRQSITVRAGKTNRVALATSVLDSPNEFMWPETMRGEVTRDRRFEKPGHIGELNGFAATNLKAITTARASEFVRLAGNDRSLRLRLWDLPGTETTASVHADHDLARSSRFLKVRIESGCLAVGLVDREGFGPIVMTPPFQKPLDVTFAAEGVASRAAERYLNPSGQRAPVALATPTEPILADLLYAIGSPPLAHAEAVWEHSVGGLASIEDAVDCLSNKFLCPAGILLAAHYLLRFLPDRLPLRAVDDLITALPDAADGPVIGAWLRLLSGAGEVKAIDPDTIDRQVHDLITLAITRPTTLFRRTRRLLTKALRLQSEFHLPEARGRAVDEPAPADFLNYGAHAGGLEAFWGTDPFSPGPQARGSTPPGRDIAGVMLRGTTFVHTIAAVAAFPARQQPLEENMSQSTAQQRVAWKAYECDADKMQIIPFGPDRIRVAPPTIDAWRALASAMESHAYQVRPSDTDSYNCRQITGGTGKSLHAYGIALDVNWTTNPFRQTPDRRQVRFSEKPTQAERAIDVKQDRADTDMTPQMIADALAIKTNDGKRVFEWGGNWTTTKDPMHFELDVTPEELASGIDWSTVKVPAGKPAPDVVAASGPKPQSAAANGPESQSAGVSLAPAGIGLGNFDAVQPLIEKWEGGFSDDPRDPGGATNMGITRATLARWRGQPVTVDDVRALTRDEARQIFRELYWKPLRGDELPLPVAQMAYNTDVLSGRERAVLVLQTALNQQGKRVAIDGDIGAETIAAAKTADQRRLVDEYADIYEAYLRGLPAFATFGRGWLNRLAEIRDAARLTGALVAASPQTPTDQGGASRAKETTMTTEEILRLILATVNTIQPPTQPVGSGVPTGRATPTTPPQPPPISPTQPGSIAIDAFTRILGAVIGTIVPQIAAQTQAQSRPQTAAGLTTQVPNSTAPPAPALRAASIETASQPVFPAAPTDMALGETIGTALAGRKTVLAMAAYAAATALKIYNPALGATVDTIMPLIYALGGWGALGKLDKWVGALAKKPTEVVATPAMVDVKLP